MKPSKLLIVIAIAVVPGAPAVAKKHHSTAKSEPLGYAYSPASRDEAIQICSSEAAKWRYSDWQTAQLTTYRNCMTQHGQQFE